MSTRWANRKKSNGVCQARLNAQGFQHIPGVRYNPKLVAAQVTNDITICIVMTLMLMALWCGKLLDVKGVFLHGEFGPCKTTIVHEDPVGNRTALPTQLDSVVVEDNLWTFCQSAYAFWLLLLSVFRSMRSERRSKKANPCLCYAWTKQKGCAFGSLGWTIAW
jgi:hypothetical protein